MVDRVAFGGSLEGGSPSVVLFLLKCLSCWKCASKVSTRFTCPRAGVGSSEICFGSPFAPSTVQPSSLLFLCENPRALSGQCQATWEDAVYCAASSWRRPRSLWIQPHVLTDCHRALERLFGTRLLGTGSQPTTSYGRRETPGSPGAFHRLLYSGPPRPAPPVPAGYRFPQAVRGICHP